MTENGVPKTNSSKKEIERNMIVPFLVDMDIYSQASKNSIKKALGQFFNYLEEKKITSPRKLDIIKYRDYLSKKIIYYKKAGEDELRTKLMSPVTVQNYLSAVRKFFAWTNDLDLYDDEAKYVRGIKIDSKNEIKIFLTAEKVKQVLDSIDTKDETGKRNYALIYLAVTTGLLGIEMSRALVRDKSTLGDHDVLYVQSKGCIDKNVYVLLPADVKARLDEYLSSRKNINPDSNMFVRVGDQGKRGPLTPDSIRHIIKDCFKAAGLNNNEIETLSSQSLRNTAAMLALMNDESPKNVMEYMRHHTMQNTLVFAAHASKLANTCSLTVANAIEQAIF